MQRSSLRARSSLRTRLGGPFALIAGCLVLAAGVAIVFERWQEATTTLLTSVEVVALDLAGPASIDDLSMTSLPRFAGSEDTFVLYLDVDGNILWGGGQPTVKMEDLLGDIWNETTELGLIVAVPYDSERGTINVAGTQCSDVALCDTVIVGAATTMFFDFAVARLGWLLGPALGVAALTYLAASWLIGRSLRPVERMRAELATITATDLNHRVAVPHTGDEFQRLGQTFNQTIERLHSTVAANERFVADAAHELRSPLTGVRAAVELEAGRTGSDLLAASVDELDRATRLVNDLLVLARRQTHSGPPPICEVDLDELLNRAVAQAAARHPRVVFTRRIKPVRVRTAPDEVLRVVVNLLDNAGRYGNGFVDVGLIADIHPERSDPSGQAQADAAALVFLTVDDNGPGIPDQDRARVFERFSRLDASRSRDTGGSGLGLAIAAELMDDLGGSIEVQDAPLGGARLLVCLPLEDPRPRIG